MKAGSAFHQNRFWGETTAFLALFLDNLGVLIFMSSILIFTFNYPADIIMTRMIARGKAIKKIAEELYLSEKTVSTYRSRIMEKMKITTNAEIISYALKNKLIE